MSKPFRGPRASTPPTDGAADAPDRCPWSEVGSAAPAIEPDAPGSASRASLAEPASGRAPWANSARQGVDGSGETRTAAPGAGVEIAALTAELATADPFRAERIVAALVRLGADAVEPLLALLREPQWGPAQWQGLEAVKRLADPRAVEPLRAALANPQARVRKAAIQALRWVAIDAETFLPGLSDDDWQTRREAVFALACLKEERLIPHFVEAAADAHHEVRSAAVNALGMLGTRAARDCLLAALRDGSAKVRAMAVWAFKRAGDKAALDGLLASLDDESQVVRRRAAEALGTLRPPGAANPLAEALRRAAGEKRYGLMREIIFSLGKIGDERGVAPLIDVVRQAPVELKHAAAWSLAAIGKPAVEPLKALLREDDERLRYFAVFALGYVGAASCAESVFKTLADESGLVRDEARRALERIKKG